MFTAAKIKATHGKGADFYRQHLANNDYYSEHDRVEGHWRGSLASVFGLENESVVQDVFFAVSTESESIQQTEIDSPEQSEFRPIL